MQPLTLAFVISLVGILSHQGWAGTGTQSPTTQRGSSVPIARAGSKKTRQPPPVASRVTRSRQLTASGSAAPWNESLEAEAAGSKVVAQEPMGRVWRSIDDQDDDDDDEQQGLFARLSAFVQAYTVREGLGSLSDEDIHCLVQLNQLRDGSSKHNAVMQPIAFVMKLIVKTSTACQFRLLAKSRMFANVGFVKGLFDVLLNGL